MRAKAHHRRWTRALLLLACFLVWFSVVVPQPAFAEAAYAGVCWVEITASYVPSVTLLPASLVQINISDSGNSFCETNQGVAPLDIHGTLTTPPIIGMWGCAAGIAEGRLTVVIDDLPGFPNPMVETVVVNSGGVMGLGMTADTITFDGAATLVQSPITTASCLDGASIGSTSWCGPLVFQDPTLS